MAIDMNKPGWRKRAILSVLEKAELEKAPESTWAPLTTRQVHERVSTLTDMHGHAGEYGRNLAMLTHLADEDKIRRRASWRGMVWSIS